MRASVSSRLHPGHLCGAAIAAAIALTPIAIGASPSGTRAEAAVTGAIEGLVIFGGAVVPTPTAVSNTTDPKVCGRSHTLEDLLVSPENRGVQNAIVALEGLAMSTPARPSEPLVLDNIECRFAPHASVMTVGGAIEMTNSDAILHTVHLYGPVEANVALPLAGMKVRRAVDAAGTIIVKCDVHGWMQAFIRVDSHPFHDVTDSTGAFRVSDVPPGDYPLSVWHEKLGTRRTNVHVLAGQMTRVVIELGRE